MGVEVSTALYSAWRHALRPRRAAHCQWHKLTLSPRAPLSMPNRAQILNAIVLASWAPVVCWIVPRGKAGREYTVHLIMGCFAVQLLARGVLDRLSDQRRAAALFGWVAWAITHLEWLCMGHVNYSTGYMVYDDDNASMLVLTITCIFIQGLVVCGATGYCAVRCSVQALSYVALATHLVSQHVPRGPDLLLSEVEFLGVFALIVVLLHAQAVSQIQCAMQTTPKAQRSPVRPPQRALPYVAPWSPTWLTALCGRCPRLLSVRCCGASSRRIYVAQLSGFAEQLAQQRDRLSFALAFAEKRAASTSSQGTPTEERATEERVTPETLQLPSNDRPESWDSHSGPAPYRPESSGSGGGGSSSGGGGSSSGGGCGSSSGGGCGSNSGGGCGSSSGGGDGGSGDGGSGSGGGPGGSVGGGVSIGGGSSISGGASVSGRSSLSAGSSRGQQRRVGGSCYGGSFGAGSGGGSSYGTESEMGDFARDFACGEEHEGEQLLTRVGLVMTTSMLEELPSSSARRRENVLWQTLADIGITPHDDPPRGRLSRDDSTSHVSSVEHLHVE